MAVIPAFHLIPQSSNVVFRSKINKPYLSLRELLFSEKCYPQFIIKKKKMTNKSVFTACAGKALLVISFSTFGLAAFTICNGQSIIGKWKGVSVKNYYSAAYAKEAGKSVDEKSAKEIGNSAIEYKSDHTFLITFSAINDPQVTSMNGTWSQTGDQLKLTMEPKYNPQKMTTTATFSISGNTMLMTAVIPQPSRIIKTVSLSTRM